MFSPPGAISGQEPHSYKAEKYVELLLADECVLMGEPAMFTRSIGHDHLMQCHAPDLEIIAGLSGLAKLAKQGRGAGAEAVLEAIAARPRVLSLLSCWMAFTP